MNMVREMDLQNRNVAEIMIQEKNTDEYQLSLSNLPV